MKRVISTMAIVAFMMTGATTHLFAQQNSKKIQRVNNKKSIKKAVKKRFRTQKEYQQMKRGRKLPQKKLTSRRRASDIFGNRRGKKIARREVIDDGWFGDAWDYPRGPRQHGYRNFKRGWYLAYRYDKAIFYDSYGYHYGYFNSYGFYFDGIFYAYDRYYRYRDRIRGRGVFDRRYYMPSNASKYGFCTHRMMPKPHRR